MRHAISNLDGAREGERLVVRPGEPHSLPHPDLPGVCPVLGIDTDDDHGREGDLPERFAPGPARAQMQHFGLGEAARESREVQLVADTQNGRTVEPPADCRHGSLHISAHAAPLDAPRHREDGHRHGAHELHNAV